jgi:hypothetical protein
MYCTNCGKEVSEGTKFCSNCGVAQEQAGIVYGDSPLVVQRTATKRSPALIIAIIVVICICVIAGIVFLPGLLGVDGSGNVSQSGSTTIGTGSSGQTGAESQSPVSKEPLIVESAEIGDVVEIAGSEYKWRILGKTNGKALLITDEIVDMRAYNKLTSEQRAWIKDNPGSSTPPDYFATTWAECSLRKWLNEDFFKTLPNAMRQQISVTDVVNDDSPEYGTSGGEDTKDKVFCLSIDEANQHFSGDEDRITKFYPSDAQMRDIAERISNNPYFNPEEKYSTAENAEENLRIQIEVSNNNRLWWLRSPGYDYFHAAVVDNDGGVIDDGYGVDYDSVGVRPTLWLNL